MNHRKAPMCPKCRVSGFASFPNKVTAIITGWSCDCGHEWGFAEPKFDR